MRICNLCGEEIAFRYIDGRPTPIHVSGGWCSGYNRGFTTLVSQPFQTVVSYVNPNALCPVCGEKVFFYQSPNGGRVFFDDLGWPWPKHKCTDNPKSQSATVKTLAQSVHTSFRNKNGTPLDLYELASLSEKNHVVEMRFRRIGKNRSFGASVTIGELRTWKVTVADIWAAPSFVVQSSGDFRVLEFISIRERAISRIVVRKPTPLS